MSLKDKICPVCGRSEKEVRFHKFICVDDFLATREMKFPEKVTIYKCREGDKIAADVRKWKFHLDELDREISKTVKVKDGKITAVIVDPDNSDVHFEIDFDGTRVKKVIPLKIKESLCDVHQRAARGYYEAIVQLRGNWEDPEPNLEKMEKLATQIAVALEPVNVVKKDVEGGIDLYIDSKQATFNVLKDLRLKSTTTRKIGGRKGGKEVYRTTFLVRI